MDFTYLTIDSTQFPVYDWSEIYGNVEEPIPPITPEAIGKVVEICMLMILTMQEISIHIDHIVNFYYTLILL